MFLLLLLNDIVKTETSFLERPFNLAVVKSIKSSVNEALTEFASAREIKGKKYEENGGIMQWI